MGVSEKEVFQQFLHTYEYIFAKTGKPVEATKLVKHRIDIGDSAPVYQYTSKRQDKRNTWQKRATGPCQQTEAMFGHRRPERPISLTGEAKGQGKADTGQPEFPPQRSQHHQVIPGRRVQQQDRRRTPRDQSRGSRKLLVH
ncbi:hypothetical protein JTB14_024498 [Gonioctena quinquepunctata]|nr:hypothetical protein JTB14_024498 [Gonioctena quinquepunctata]